MRLSQRQFDRLLQKKQLVLSFIGMSNVGKTYWSKKLGNVGFKHFNCDDLIEAKLAPDLKKQGYLGIKNVSRWMGQPYDDRFPINQQKYLSFEKEVMEGIYNQVKNRQNIVIDTTGSVIHAGKDICFKLKKYSLIVYLETDKIMRKKMFDQYIKKPKPVIFGNVFNRKKNETNIQALERCYQKLLNLRTVLYAQCADVVVSRRLVRKNMNANEFILLVRQLL